MTNKAASLISRAPDPSPVASFIIMVAAITMSSRCGHRPAPYAQQSRRHTMQRAAGQAQLGRRSNRSAAIRPLAAHPTAQKPSMRTPKPVSRRSIACPRSAMRRPESESLHPLSPKGRYPAQSPLAIPVDLYNTPDRGRKGVVVRLYQQSPRQTRSLAKWVMTALPFAAPPGGKKEKLVPLPAASEMNSVGRGASAL